MNTLRSYSLRILLFMAIFLPFWLTFGKTLFAEGGWFTVIYLFTIAPLLLVSLLVVWFLLRSRPDVKQSGRVGTVDATVLLSLYTTIFLHGIFLVDGSDVKGDSGSIATAVAGISQSLSMGFAIVLFGLSIVLLFSIFMLSLYELWSKKSINLRPKA